ncbi:MAG: SprB repeat-containing protein, partial [Bacteroidota bacterium]
GEALLCFGDSDGDIDLTVSGGTLPYTYTWDNGAGTDEDPVGLTAGDYAVTVTDNNGCTIERSASITEPTELIAAATGEILLCFGDSDGNIDLTVSGGSQPYTYIWDNGAGTDEDPVGLTAGDYAVTVTDNNGCTIERSASITEPAELVATATGEALLCFGDNDGDIDLTVSGGSQPYTYAWDNGAGTTEDITGLT